MFYFKFLFFLRWIVFLYLWMRIFYLFIYNFSF